MSFQYHALGRINDESLRQVYLNSLPTELYGELQRTIELSNRSLRDITLGEIHMFTLTSLDKLCATQRIFTKMIKEDRKYDKQIVDDIPSDADIESILSERDDVNLHTTFMVQILVEKYSKPISAIAYFDTGTHSTMMNPRVLPPDAWREKDNEFLATDGQIFTTNLVSKHKIGIQFFPTCTLWTHVIGTHLPDKDILIG
ncbi:hypothetical protein Ddye_003638 [Dipteronia dyeriana]|uniref:Uncharacterized protein n=1 Tax=Dipteronia dyeriana TaxID=168575 RepID=A0AAE0CVM9_9ROSI|nr:hypothetical protein Ddye_003638 [Dipteronia dyeriana]